MTEPEASPETPVPARRARGRRGKLILLAAIIVALGTFYVLDLMPPSLPEQFGTDLRGTLTQAREDIRPMLILFWAPRRDKDALRHVLGDKGLRQRTVVQAIEKGNFLCVAVKLDRKLESDLAKEYGITRVPTLITFTSMGAELDRLEGRKGHADMESMLVKATRKPS